MMQESARTSLNRAIEALLSEGSIQSRLANVDCCIAELEQHRSEVPDGCLDVLKDVVSQLAHLKEIRATDAYLSAEEESALSDELLSLYITASGGSLVF